MYDESDIQAVVGRPPYALGEIKGRGFVKLENVNPHFLHPNQSESYSPRHFHNKSTNYSVSIR